jgi:cytochrome c biogenesis protein CcdA
VLIKYEIQQEPANAPVFGNYGSQYGFELGIPLILFGKNDYLQGDQPIIDGLRNKVNSMYSNPCPLLNGSFVDFNSCDFNSLPGKPEILISGKNVPINNTNGSCQPQPKQELTLAKIISLAAVDAINPCAFAVLILILVAILTDNPSKKSKVLWAGLAFALAVFLTYLVYGLVIVIFFQAIRALTYVKPFLHIVIAVIAILLGLLNIRDFLSYVPGRFATEMPVMFRPKVKKIISKVTSPLGAFIVGAFVTTFLLPCTVGPYLIAGGILSSLQLVHTLPWLGLYNFVFALPMVIITLIIYFGFSSVENVSGWRERNIKYIHLAAGLIMLILGIAMLTGLI